jgi:hypothetical protein
VGSASICAWSFVELSGQQDRLQSESDRVGAFLGTDVTLSVGVLD